MLGGWYPPAFLMPIKDKFKMLGGYPPAFFMPIKTSLKCLVGLFYATWLVSTSLFNANKRQV
jgi:hypothetical protein